MDYYKEPKWKKRCRRCKYHTIMTGGDIKGDTTACYYIGMTEKRRGCPGAHCDKFEPMRRGKKKGANYEEHIDGFE